MGITIKPDESLMIIGMKGSGKSFLLEYLIGQKNPKGRERVVILDTKQTGDFSQYPRVDELKNLHLVAQENPIIVYAPNHYELKSPLHHNAFLAWAYDRWDTIVAIDELGQIVKGNDVSAEYADVTDRGRARNVTVWQGNQKPVFLPHAALSESDHYFLFDLMVDKDREKMVGILGKKVMQRPIHPHGFWYYYRHNREPYYVPGIKI